MRSRAERSTGARPPRAESSNSARLAPTGPFSDVRCARLASAVRHFLAASTCVVHATANTIEMLALYLGMLDAEFTVTEPPELLERLGKLAERFLSVARRRST